MVRWTSKFHSDSLPLSWRNDAIHVCVTDCLMNELWEILKRNCCGKKNLKGLGNRMCRKQAVEVQTESFRGYTGRGISRNALTDKEVLSPSNLSWDLKACRRAVNLPYYYVVDCVGLSWATSVYCPGDDSSHLSISLPSVHPETASVKNPRDKAKSQIMQVAWFLSILPTTDLPVLETAQFALLLECIQMKLSHILRL
jgi:hypothetical protein